MIAVGILTAALLAPAPVAEPAKRALLIGVQYQEERLKLNTSADVDAMQKTLEGERYGFPTANILVRNTEAETTREGLLRSFGDLVNATQEGDIVYVHYSGHGDQVPDKDGDEPDGYDETLVPADLSPSGDNQILDEEVGAFIDKLMAKKPASVTLIFDCCHSGTISRGPKVRRIPNDFWKGERPQLAIRARGQERSGGMVAPGRTTRLVMMSAARSDQPAFETVQGDAMGSFTYGMVKALTSPEVGPKTTARELFERACQHVKEQNKLQVPMIEGQLDMEFLGGDVRPSEPYLPLLIRQGSLYAPAGSFQGLTEGSEVEIHKAGTSSPTPETKIASATVGTPSTFESPLTLASEDNGKMGELRQSAGLRIFETRRAAPDNGMKVAVAESLQTVTAWTGVEGSIKSLPIVTSLDYVASDGRAMPQGDYTVLIEPSASAGKVRMMRKDGTPLPMPEVDLASPESARTLQAALNQEARWQFLYAMRNTAQNTGVKVSFRLIPVEVENDPDFPEAKRFVRDQTLADAEGGEVALKSGEFFRVEVKNTGSQDAYLNILSLNPTGGVDLVFPYDEDAQANAAFAPCSAVDADDPTKGWVKLENPDGSGHRRPIVWQLSDDEGLEVFKLLATLDRVRVEPFLTPQTARGARSNGSFLEEFLKASTLGQRTNRVTRGAVKDWWAEQVNVRISK